LRIFPATSRRAIIRAKYSCSASRNWFRRRNTFFVFNPSVIP
jgi:hypothetical protein